MVHTRQRPWRGRVLIQCCWRQISFRGRVLSFFLFNYRAMLESFMEILLKFVVREESDTDINQTLWNRQESINLELV